VAPCGCAAITGSCDPIASEKIKTTGTMRLIKEIPSGHTIGAFQRNSQGSASAPNAPVLTSHLADTPFADSDYPCG
jgi:hypothetical protein